jgi:Fungal Zn(2)-Cys(6) binuclear cluster domain/Aflatoxin regulatory protein
MPPTDLDSPSALQLRKLRLSCDSCHAAKVKCSKDRPSCSRCASRGFSCVYSKSRRAGKPKRSANDSLSFRSTDTASPPAVAHSLPSSPPWTPADLSMDVDMNLMPPWNLDFSGSCGLPDPSKRQTSPNFPDLKSQQSTGSYFGSIGKSHPSGSVGCRRSLDSNFRLSNLNGGIEDSEEPWLSSFNPDMISTGTGLTPDWMFDLAPASNALPFSLDNMASHEGASNTPYPELTPEKSTIDSPSSERRSPYSCSCSTTLHETLSTLNSPSLSFDRLLAINKSAVTCVTDHLSCQCVPDISSIMVLSVIITKVVQWYRRSRHGQGQGSEEVGVTMGVFKMDSEDEHQIKTVLIRSELRKIKMLMTRSRERFEKYLDGQDRELYEANMAFLEQGLEDTIRSL